jgi:hypothetical protein
MRIFALQPASAHTITRAIVLVTRSERARSAQLTRTRIFDARVCGNSHSDEHFRDQ